MDLFDVSANEEQEERKETKPFKHRVHLQGPRGEVVRVWANIDDGAMREVMLMKTFGRVKHRLRVMKPSTQLLCVANGVIIQSKAQWEGEIEVNGVCTNIGFELFDSGGKWDFLFGKTLLEAFCAIHNYKLDEIVIKDNKGTTMTL